MKDDRCLEDGQEAILRCHTDYSADFWNVWCHWQADVWKEAHPKWMEALTTEVCPVCGLSNKERNFQLEAHMSFECDAVQHVKREAWQRYLRSNPGQEKKMAEFFGEIRGLNKNPLRTETGFSVVVRAWYWNAWLRWYADKFTQGRPMHFPTEKWEYSSEKPYYKEILNRYKKAEQECRKVKQPVYSCIA